MLSDTKRVAQSIDLVNEMPEVCTISQMVPEPQLQSQLLPYAEQTCAGIHCSGTLTALTFSKVCARSVQHGC